MGGEACMEVELRILDFIQSLRTPFGDVAMPFISKLGNTGMIWIILALVLLIIPKTRNYGILVTAALLADVILCDGILKQCFLQRRLFTHRHTLRYQCPVEKTTQRLFLDFRNQYQFLERFKISLLHQPDD